MSAELATGRPVAATRAAARGPRSGPSTVHLVTPYLWPDDAPTGIHAEHVADALAAEGLNVD